MPLASKSNDTIADFTRASAKQALVVIADYDLSTESGLKIAVSAIAQAIAVELFSSFGERHTYFPSLKTYFRPQRDAEIYRDYPGVSRNELARRHGISTRSVTRALKREHQRRRKAKPA